MELPELFDPLELLLECEEDRLDLPELPSESLLDELSDDLPEDLRSDLSESFELRLVELPDVDALPDALLDARVDDLPDAWADDLPDAWVDAFSDDFPVVRPDDGGAAARVFVSPETLADPSEAGAWGAPLLDVPERA